jgi:hypothetical protein
LLANQQCKKPRVNSQGKEERMKVRTRLLAALLFAMSAAVAPLQVRAQSSDLLKPEQLEQLVAPIALYPDPLLAEMLMAATYPLEVVSADRWIKQNKTLKGEQLKAAAEKQGWDKSVVSLTATPDVLGMMSDKLEMTQQLGDAVLAQQADVMDAIQRLRAKAQDQKKLASTEEQTVTTKREQNKNIIVIEPAVPNTVYVPYYDPAVVYGPWPWPAYPPYYFPRPGYIAAGVIATGIAFGAGYAVGRWASGGNYWGGGVNWGGNTINVNRPIDINRTQINHFSHNPEHRHGVKYRNNDVQQKFGNRTAAAGADRRIDFRGHDGQQVLRPDAGTRPGGGDRPGAGDRPGGGDRPNLGDRPGGGDRPNARPGADRPRPEARPKPAQRPGGGGGGGAFANLDKGGLAKAHSNRGHASLGGGGGGARIGHGGGGGARVGHGGGGGARAAAGGGGRGGGGGGGGRGGGRR